jgi:hypothetical protein
MFSSIALLSSGSVALAQLGPPQPCLYPLQFTAQMHTFYYGKNLMEVCNNIPAVDNSMKLAIATHQLGFRQADVLI